MKVIFGLSILFTFSALAVFGFVLMTPMNEAGHSDCWMLKTAGANCPKSITASALFHLETLKGFSLAVLPFIILMLGALLFLRTGFLDSRPAWQKSFFRQLSDSETFALPVRAQLRLWLSRHENSPAF